MAVVPSGRKTKEGKPIYEAAPTQTDIRRKASEQRVQVFKGSTKISDTGRVEVTVQGEKKFVTPERALQITQDQAKVQEAKQKIERRKKLEQTIRERLEKKEEPTVTQKIEEKKAVKIGDKEKLTPESAAKKPYIFPAIIAAKEGIKEAKRKQAMIDNPELFPSYFGLARETYVGRKASKEVTQQTPFGRRQTFEQTIVGRPEKVTQFTPTGLLTLPKVGTPTKEESFKAKVEESTFGKGMKEVSGQYGVSVYSQIAKPVAKFLLTPLPKAQKEVRKVAPSEEEVRTLTENVGLKLTSEVAYRLGTPKGLGSTALTIGTFAVGVGAAGVLAKGTRYAKPLAGAVKYSPYIFTGLLGTTRLVSGGLRVSGGEGAYSSFGKEAGQFSGEIISYGAVAGGLSLGLKGASKLVKTTKRPIKLVSARERTLVGKGGKTETAFEIETILGREFKSRGTPKIKPAKLAFKESAIKIVKSKGGLTKLATGERLGLAEISFPKGKKPLVKITKVKGININEPLLLIGQEPLLGKAEFAKRSPFRESIFVKGYTKTIQQPLKGYDVFYAESQRTIKNLKFPKERYVTKSEMRKIDFTPYNEKASIGVYTEPTYLVKRQDKFFKIGTATAKVRSGAELKPVDKASKAFADYYFPKKVTYDYAGYDYRVQPDVKVEVQPYMRKGAIVKQTIFKADKVKGLKPTGFKETEFLLLQPKTRVKKPVKITSAAPTFTEPNTLIDLKTGKSYSEIKITKKKFDIGTLKFKDVTKSKFVEIKPEVPKIRELALSRVQDTKLVTKQVSQVTTSKAKPTIGYLEKPSKLKLGISKLSQNLVFVAPPEQEYKAQLPKAGTLQMQRSRFDIKSTPISGIKSITGQRQILEQTRIPTRITGEPIIDITQDKTPDTIRIQGIISVPDLVTDYPQPRPRPFTPQSTQIIPPGGIFIPPLGLFGGEAIYRRQRPTKKDYAFTPDFIAAVRNEYAKPTKQTLFTGQERRYRIRGKGFVSKLPKNREGIIGLIARTFGR